MEPAYRHNISKPNSVEIGQMLALIPFPQEGYLK